MTARLSLVIEYPDAAAMPTFGPATKALGGRVVACAFSDRLVSPDAPKPSESSLLSLLSAREHAVLTMLADGLSVRAIGERLGISPKTVQSYRYRIHETLGVANDIQAVTMFIKATENHHE